MLIRGVQKSCRAIFFWSHSGLRFKNAIEMWLWTKAQLQWDLEHCFFSHGDHIFGFFDSFDQSVFVGRYAKGLSKYRLQIIGGNIDRAGYGLQGALGGKIFVYVFVCLQSNFFDVVLWEKASSEAGVGVDVNNAPRSENLARISSVLFSFSM